MSLAKIFEKKVVVFIKIDIVLDNTFSFHDTLGTYKGTESKPVLGPNCVMLYINIRGVIQLGPKKG